MIRYVSAFIVSLFLITPALASQVYATVDNRSPSFMNMVRDDGSSIIVAPYQRLVGVPFKTRTTVSNFVNGRHECSWYIHSSVIERLDTLIYNPENLIHGFSPCTRLTRA